MTPSCFTMELRNATCAGLTAATFGSESHTLLADVPLEACNMWSFTGQPVKCDVALKVNQLPFPLLPLSPSLSFRHTCQTNSFLTGVLLRSVKLGHCLILYPCLMNSPPVHSISSIKMLSIHCTSVLQVARDKWTHPINHLTETFLFVQISTPT